MAKNSLDKLKAYKVMKERRKQFAQKYQLCKKYSILEVLLNNAKSKLLIKNKYRKLYKLHRTNTFKKYFPLWYNQWSYINHFMKESISAN